MCQVFEDYRDELESAETPSVSKKCVKCREASAAVVVRAADAYCRGCFKLYFVHKFRAMLGKNRVIFPGEKVLLAVSGGPSSFSMLNQVQEGLSQNAHKKLRFVPGIVHIDEGGAVGQSVEERQRTAAELQALFRATGFPFYIIPLEQVLDLPSSVLASAPLLPEQPSSSYKAAVDRFIQSNSSSCGTQQDRVQMSIPEVQESRTHALQQLMISVKTLTARQELLSTLRQHLLVHTARTQGYSKLMLGDSCTRLAVKLLTSIALGRGAHLAQDTGFADSRYGDVVLVKPMRDHSAKEIAFYSRLFHVPSVIIPSLDAKMSDKASVQSLTQNFVARLQADFPSTVSTIYRTSEKLQTSCGSSSAAEHSSRCLLCMCSLDTAVENASAFQATLISDQLSQNTSSAATRTMIPTEKPAPVHPGSIAPTGQCCASGGGDDCVRAGGGCSSAKDLRSLLCYSCQLTVKDMSSVELLPQYVLSRTQAQRPHTRSQMREDIGEFLLDRGDEDD